MTSLSRQLARWVAALRYEDLPPAVVDRAKGVTLHSLASVLLGSRTPGGRQAVKLITEEEEGVRSGATIMVDGAKVTKGGAAFANAEMAMAGGKWDTFRMLTHPGTSIVPGAFVAAETAGVSGKDFITGLVAGYEVMERMAADFIPTVMARGFHAGVVFGIFGPAVAAAKIDGKAVSQLVKFIQGAKHSVDVAIYDMKNPDVLKALKGMSTKVNLHILFDAGKAGGSSTTVDPKLSTTEQAIKAARHPSMSGTRISPARRQSDSQVRTCHGPWPCQMLGCTMATTR